MATASIPAGLLPALQRDPRVRHLELPPGLALRSQADVGEPSLQAKSDGAPDFLAELGAFALPADLDGRGTLVGVVDAEGLDVHHAAFVDADGRTRVAWLWDQGGVSAAQGAAGAAPTPWGYGLEYSRYDIDRELQLAQGSAAHSVVGHRAAKLSHGTHVAGIAAGAEPGRYRGVAPGAGLIYVDTVVGEDGSAPATAVADALHYVFERAGTTPCCVNLSLGVGCGPHDGESPLERFIERLLRVPGRAVVVAAGNHNTTAGGDGTKRDGHASGVVPRDGETVVSLSVTGQAARETLELWYSGEDRFDLELVHPLGQRSPVLAAGSGTTSFDLDGWPITVTSELAFAPNGRSVIRILVRPPASAGQAGAFEPAGPPVLPPWQVILHGRTVLDGRFEAWLEGTTGSGFQFLAPERDAGRDRITLVSPGTARSVLTVGAYSVDGVRGFPHVDVMDLSGRGPTLDGRTKPDVVAYGGAVSGPAAHVPTRYSVKHGTSVAAPQATGAAALLFQCRGESLHAADLTELLHSLAEGPREGPGNAWGWGKLRVDRIEKGRRSGARLLVRKHAGDSGIVPCVGPAPWVVPDLRVVPVGSVGARHSEPTPGQEHEVRVRVTNAGEAASTPGALRLEWSDGATWTPDDAWRTTGLTVSGRPANEVPLPAIGPGETTEVVFGWAVPEEGAMPLGGPRFALRAAVVGASAEMEPADRSRELYSPGVAIKRVWLSPPVAGTATFAWQLTAPGGEGGLWLDLRGLPVGSTVVVRLPLSALFLGAMPSFERAFSLALLDDLAGARGAEARRKARSIVEETLAGSSISLDSPELRRSVGIHGAAAVRLTSAEALITVSRSESPPVALLERLAVAASPLRVAVDISAPPWDSDFALFIDVGQLDAGRLIGGARLVLAANREPGPTEQEIPIERLWRALLATTD